MIQRHGIANFLSFSLNCSMLCGFSVFSPRNGEDWGVWEATDADYEERYVKKYGWQPKPVVIFDSGTGKFQFNIPSRGLSVWETMSLMARCSRLMTAAYGPPANRLAS